MRRWAWFALAVVVAAVVIDSLQGIRTSLGAISKSLSKREDRERNSRYRPGRVQWPS